MIFKDLIKLQEENKQLLLSCNELRAMNYDRVQGNFKYGE
jgi:hypothetical protein